MPKFDGLELGRCRLVPFSEAHLSDRYVAWLNDPATVRFSEQRHRSHDRRSCEAYFRDVAASGDLFIAIEAPELGHVGNITVSIDGLNRSADVSIMVGEAAARGRGIATAAWCAIVDWLLGEGGMRRVTAGTMERNRPMIELLKKSGMTIETIRPRAFLCEGEEIGCVLAARFADGPAVPDEKEI